MDSRQLHGTCQLPAIGLFVNTALPIEERFRTGGSVKVHSLTGATQHNGQQGKLLASVVGARRLAVELSLGGKIRVQPVNLHALDDLHPLLFTPTVLQDPANIWCLPPGLLWWSNAMLELSEAFYQASAEVSRTGALDGLTFQAPTFTLDPGLRPKGPCWVARLLYQRPNQASRLVPPPSRCRINTKSKHQTVRSGPSWSSAPSS